MKIEGSCQPRTLGNTVKYRIRALGKQPFISTLQGAYIRGAYIRGGLTFGGHFVLVSCKFYCYINKVSIILPKTIVLQAKVHCALKSIQIHSDIFLSYVYYHINITCFQRNSGAGPDICISPHFQRGGYIRRLIFGSEYVLVSRLAYIRGLIFGGLYSGFQVREKSRSTLSVFPSLKASIRLQKVKKSVFFDAKLCIFEKKTRQ